MRVPVPLRLYAVHVPGRQYWAPPDASIPRRGILWLVARTRRGIRT